MVEKSLTTVKKQFIQKTKLMKTFFSNTFLKSFFALFFLFLSNNLLFSQGADPFPAGTNSAPIDGGILGLLAAGVALGAKHLLKKNKNES